VTDLGAVERNLRLCFRALTAARPDAENRVSSGVEVISLGVRFQMFNAAFLSSLVSDGTDLERRILSARVRFGVRGISWSFWLCDGLLTPALNRRAGSLFERHGLRLATQMPGMLADQFPAPNRKLPHIEVAEVRNAATLASFCDIGSACFRVPVAWFEEVFDANSTARAPFRGWLGYANGKPVCTAATVADGSALGLYNVATIPAFRARGYAEAIMREAITRETAAAERPIVLQSTASGMELYRRLGFRKVTNFRVWIS
jgi:ribosomal protein S18 acetylase RimI-like enzyme